MRSGLLTLCAAAGLLSLPRPSRAAAAGQPAPLLTERSVWRCYYRFAVARYSSAALKAEGPKVLGRGWGRVRRDAERALRQRGIDPAKVDWRDHLLQPMHRNFSPIPAPVPPADWAELRFDDHCWVRRRGFFQGGGAAQITDPVLGQFDESQDLGLQAAYSRARFVVDDPARAALTLRMTYTGGVRAFVNGREVARGHLPPGDPAPDAPADDYSAAAYGRDGARLRTRVVGPVTIPAGLLRKGVNVLAVEVRASRFHPVVLTHPRQANWGGPTRPWPHGHLSSLALRGAAAGAGGPGQRPPGVQVWAEDIHHRVDSREHLPAGEAPGSLRVVGVRNGTHAAQLVVGTDRPLGRLRVTIGTLARVGGGAPLPASAAKVLYGVPFPSSQWTIRRLGDERGLEAWFPTSRQLAAYAAMPAGGEVWLFDQLTPGPPARVPPDTCRPVWLSLRVPTAAAPGEYRGTVTVAADGRTVATVPLNLTVLDWRLPEPGDFRTFVGCEQNPYGVAGQYGVRVWSDEHLRLLEASFRQLGRIGNQWLNVPVLVNTEFGNGTDSTIRWIRRRDGTYAFDFSVLDRYLDLAEKHCGKPRAVQFVVLHGMKGAGTPPPAPMVKVWDEASGRARLTPVGPVAAMPREIKAAWRSFAVSLRAHMRSRKLERAMYWGAPLEHEADPGLKDLLAACTPGIYWTAGGHEIMANAKYAKNHRYYRLITTIRYNGGFPFFRDDQGWRSKTPHMLNPRVGGTAFALHTTSHPFAYRVLPDRALAFGRTGFTRVGADEWAAVHYKAMAIPRWLTGIPVLFTLWPGAEGAEPGARFECLLEGIQEAEARIYVERALVNGGLAPALADRARKALAENLQKTRFFAGNSIIHSFEQYPYRWQERSRRLYQAAADVAEATKR